MDTKEIIRLYTKEMWTLRMIADATHTDHHQIKRVLVSNGIEITKRKTLKPYTDEHKRKVGLAAKGRKTNLGKKMPRASLYKNMKAHLDYDVSLEWLTKFKDVEKLKFLNRAISRSRDNEGFTSDIYMQYVEKFYHDDNFNKIYLKWLQTGDKWMRPSLDHISAKSKGGTLFVDNLQFLTWLENRTKVDMEESEWNNIKKRIQDYFV